MQTLLILRIHVYFKIVLKLLWGDSNNLDNLELFKLKLWLNESILFDTLVPPNCICFCRIHAFHQRTKTEN